MKTVTFQNNGLIDPVAIRTFGVNVKDSDSAIGFFGTGLKYAIAILLRNGCDIRIHRGTELIEFSTRTQVVRDKEFQLVCMNGEDMGFTLELGKTWALWQAFRELYCNTLDEHGTTFGNACAPEEGMTTIHVSGDAFYEEYARRDQIVLMSKPRYMLKDLEVHDSVSTSLFYQSIKVGQLEYPSIFTYNALRGVQLTEDRTIKVSGDFHKIVRQAVLYGTDEEFITRFLTAPEGTYEAKVDLDYYETPGETFMHVMQGLPFHHVRNNTAARVYSKHRPRKQPQPVTDINAIEQQQLTKAIQFCKRIGQDVEKWPICVTDELPDNVLSMAAHKTIYLARRVFMMGTKMVAGTLFEEHLHLEKGYSDCSRDMQNYLFDLIVSLGEQLNGEAI